MKTPSLIRIIMKIKAVHELFLECFAIVEYIVKTYKNDKIIINFATNIKKLLAEITG